MISHKICTVVPRTTIELPGGSISTETVGAAEEICLERNNNLLTPPKFNRFAYKNRHRVQILLPFPVKIYMNLP